MIDLYSRRSVVADEIVGVFDATDGRAFRHAAAHLLR